MTPSLPNTSDASKIVTDGLNRIFANREPWQVATITATTVLSTVWFWNFIWQDESLWDRGKKTFFHYAKMIPKIRREVESELEKSRKDFEAEISKNRGHLPFLHELPTKGLSSEEILELVDQHLHKGDFDWRDGRVSGAIYAKDDKDLKELVTTVYGRASYTNPLHPDVFPGVCKMEAEVVRMACSLFHGNADSCGTMTTGGTESIIMACKAYRDFALKTKNIKSPNMVVPRTAHAAFDKAAQYFKIHIKYVDVDPNTLEVDLKKMKSAINCNTVLLVGSAPNFPYGTIDDIEAIAEMGVKYNIPVHVDACLGSFVAALTREAGYNIKRFDFAIKGVTSISADTHKYGFAPKGSSVILYSHKKYRQCQFTVTTDWPGGIYGSPSINGSRAGGIIAACWATMMNFGHDGYLQATKRIVDTARHIEAGIRKIDGLFIFGKPATSVVAMGSKVFDIYRLSSDMLKLGWHLNNLQFPSGIHICVTDLHTGPKIADKFLSDLRSCVAEIMKDPGVPVEGKLAIYGMAQGVPDRAVIGDVTRLYLDSMYYTPPKK